MKTIKIILLIICCYNYAYALTSDEIEDYLRGTTWTGSYLIHDVEFETILYIKSVGDGFIGAEVIHKNSSDGDSKFLDAKIAGDIVVQYELSEDEFVDEDRIDPLTLLRLKDSVPQRYLIRLKRVRAIKFDNGSGGGGWSTNREYRLELNIDSNYLKGIVGVPTKIYGNVIDTEEKGQIILTLASRDGSRTDKNCDCKEIREAAYNLGKEFCKENPKECGLDLKEEFQAGKEYCINNPSACGIDTGKEKECPICKCSSTVDSCEASFNIFRAC